MLYYIFDIRGAKGVALKANCQWLATYADNAGLRLEDQSKFALTIAWGNILSQ